MKISLLVGCLFGAVSLFAADPFVAPSFVKELEDLEKVQKKAIKENKAVTFLLMEPGST
ncbi:hypothetical protein OAE61_02235 [Verrucomicrobiales bacterium]|jgi:hypothetical protein|nr:hypothetical protein [Verrucomicrobiales bacterium]MDC0259434.1 hypothetical protein [Verrucomicrobiales bacterium]